MANKNFTPAQIFTHSHMLNYASLPCLLQGYYSPYVLTKPQAPYDGKNNLMENIRYESSTEESVLKQHDKVKMANIIIEDTTCEVWCHLNREATKRALCFMDFDGPSTVILSAQ